MKKLFLIVSAFFLVVGLAGCTDLDPVNTNLDELEAKIAELESKIAELESDVDGIEIPEVPVFTFDNGTLVVDGEILIDDLVLPELDGVDIVWTSSDTTVLTSDGKVIRPAYSRGDTEVTLTAVIVQNGLTSTKSFDFKVAAVRATDKEKVEMALAALPEIPTDLTEDLVLPTEAGGAQIIWESTNEMYVSADGKVMRPHYDFADETAVLTAFIVAGKELKIFKQNVTVKKMDYAVHGSLGNPFTVKLSSAAGHTIYVPIENVDKPAYTYNEQFPYIYTPEFGTNIPTSVNGWGFALVVNSDGTVVAYYDGLNGKMVDAADPDNPVAINAGHYAKDQSDPACAADVTTCPGLPIPADGYVIVFQNTGASNKNNRQFGYTYFRDLGDITIEGLTTTPSTIQYKIEGGVWWRGKATVWVPKSHINPDVTTFNYSSVVEVDGSDVSVAAAPVIFTNSYGTAAGNAVTTNLDILNGWGIAAEITPETEMVQQIGPEGEEYDYTLTNPWQISRVYDGIGGSIKNRVAPGVGESTPVGGADYAKDIRLPAVGYVIVFPGTSWGYGSDGDVHNRRIGADYFYHLENWIFDPEMVEATGLQTPVKGVFE